MTSTLMDKTRKAAITGAISAAASAFIFGQTGDTDLLGIPMPVNAAVGLANAASSLVADYAHDYILPQIPGNAKYTTLEGAALGLGISGGGTAYLLNSEDIGSQSTMNAFLLGAGSYAAGDYIDSKVFGGQTSLPYY